MQGGTSSGIVYGFYAKILHWNISVVMFSGSPMAIVEPIVSSLTCVESEEMDP